jgi:hypothetical protein
VLDGHSRVGQHLLPVAGRTEDARGVVGQLVRVEHEVVLRVRRRRQPTEHRRGMVEGRHHPPVTGPGRAQRVVDQQLHPDVGTGLRGRRRSRRTGRHGARHRHPRSARSTPHEPSAAGRSARTPGRGSPRPHTPPGRGGPGRSRCAQPVASSRSRETVTLCAGRRGRGPATGSPARPAAAAARATCTGTRSRASPPAAAGAGRRWSRSSAEVQSPSDPPALVPAGLARGGRPSQRPDRTSADGPSWPGQRRPGRPFWLSSRAWNAAITGSVSHRACSSSRVTRRAMPSTSAAVRPPVACSRTARRSRRRTSAEVGMCSAAAR